MKKNILNKKLIIFLFIGLFFLLPNIVFSAGCAWSCRDATKTDKDHCSSLFGGATVGNEFIGECSTSRKINCSMYQAPTCCCTDHTLITPTERIIKTTPIIDPPKIQINLPTLNLESMECKNLANGRFSCSVPWIANYVSAIYNYGLTIGGILAAIILMAGGVLWLTSGGDAGSVSKAKNLIFSSITGLIILFGSYIILYEINPELTKLKSISVTFPEDTEGAEREELSSSQWSWDPGIKNQIGDASLELMSLLNCMRPKLKDGVGRISSISDSNIIGRLEVCNVQFCDVTICQHSCQSCHYGGSLPTNKSYAVDFGDEENKEALTKAAKECGASFILDEGNHIHVSTPSCPKN